MEKLILKTTLVSIIFFGIGFIFIYFVRGTFTDGQVLYSSNLNQLSPSGFVGAFNLTTCPTGRKSADGTDGTPDLRGSFIRGINGHLNSRDIERQLASYQQDALQQHKHNILAKDHFGGGSGHGIRHDGVDKNYFVGDVINARTSNETRPKNVALLYCIKE